MKKIHTFSSDLSRISKPNLDYSATGNYYIFHLSGICKNSRECISDQLCIDGTCRLTCYSNSSCPEFQSCLNRICTKESLCTTNEDCNDDEQCLLGDIGIPQCRKVCDFSPCGRHAVCISKSHKATCSCREGYLGDPMQSCLKKECDFDTDCTDDKFCHKNICKITCLNKNPCGRNTICSSENHKQVCYCQPGYTGDPSKGCTEMNWCSSNPCGDGAECKNLKNTAVCSCPPGTVGNAYEDGCHKAQECRFNRDCPAVAKCAVIGGIRKCAGKYDDHLL